MGQETEESSLGLEGWAPVPLLENPVFLPAVAPLTFTGVAPFIPDRVRTARPGVVARALVGQVPTVQISNSPKISTAAGTLALAGEVPLVSSETARKLTPAATTLALGEQAVYIGRSLSVPSRAVSLVGKVPTVPIGANPDITPAVDTLVLAGQTPLALLGPTQAPDEGTLTLAGYAPTVTPTTDHLAEPAAAALTFTTHSISAKITLSISTPVASLALSTNSVGLSTKRLQREGARTQFISLTTRNNVEMLYK